MRRSDFFYALPERLIAQRPLDQRSASRLLVVDGPGACFEDRAFEQLGELLRAGDLLVMNDTRVVPARLLGRKPTGGRVEVMLERVLDDRRCLALLRASKSPKPGSLIVLDCGQRFEVEGRDADLFALRWLNDVDAEGVSTLLALFERFGAMPLPPYIERESDEEDRGRYQTVFARQAGAVAAPTAGLHFDEPMLQRLKEQGVETAFVTLHVGAGTFQPVRVDRLDEHEMHAEWLSVGEDVVQAVRRTRARGGRVVAVGTTCVRSLETAAASGRLQPFEGESRLFIFPGYRFQVVDAMVTNFHLPESTLLMLVCAFAGYDTMMAAYRHAVEQGYRFFSYGDAQFLTRQDTSEADEGG